MTANPSQTNSSRTCCFNWRHNLVPSQQKRRQFKDVSFKELLKSSLRQIDIWMTTYPIEVL